ncbi:MAG TPA: divergent polysaccharide deacetylase family protein [Firmicutes bacterium]|nr:divergent polysaccharide deacetylase family protein [Bacillota bacterium]
MPGNNSENPGGRRQLGGQRRPDRLSLAGLAVLLFLALLAGCYLLKAVFPSRSVPVTAPPAVVPPSETVPPLPEEEEEEAVLNGAEAETTPDRRALLEIMERSWIAHQEGDRPKLALIIDDWGYYRQAENDFLQMDLPLSIAVLPYLGRSRSDALAAQEAGFDVLLHLPMEPGGEDETLVNGQKGMITTSQSDEEVRAAVAQALAEVPGAIAVNNHMGSKATADLRVMRAVLATIKENGLFFVDSRTTAATKGLVVGVELDMPVLERAVFLDDQDDEEYIRSQLLKAARIAMAGGYAVAIGHVRAATARAIAGTVEEIKDMGVALVRVSELVSSDKIILPEWKKEQEME